MFEKIQETIKASGGTATLHKATDESGRVVHAFGTASFPLRKDHWIYQKGADGFGFPPPMPLRMPSDSTLVFTITEADPAKNPGWVGGRTLRLDKQQMCELIRAAGKYAVRASTMHGSENDFDPDAMLQNLVIGFLGYFTETGFGGEKWEDPEKPWEVPEIKARHPMGSIHEGNEAL